MTKLEKADAYLIHAYNRTLVFERGEDVYLYDDTGKKYLDFGAGIAVSALGYSNKEYKEAVKQQVDKLIHISNLYHNEKAIEAGEKFTKASGMDKVFFTNSGTEAIEGALKLARKYGGKRYHIVAMEHSFHGRSMGALSVTGTKKYREPFEPLIGGVSFAEYNNMDSVRKQVTEDTCAILLEVIQGEGGMHPAKREFLQELRALCDEKDIVLIFDEIQCGMGRTGKMFAYQNYGVLPDVMTSAKGLGCGMPIGAFAAVDKVAEALVPGDHGTTYGGNPLATAAACAVFDAFEREAVLENVVSTGAYLAERLCELQKKYRCIRERRGLGLMQGLEFDMPVADIIREATEKGLLLIAAGTHVIRFVPPLVIKNTHVDAMCEILEECLQERA